MTEQEYRAAPGINISSLKKMAKSPAHYRWGLDHPQEDTPTLAAGRAVHMAILQPELFDQHYVIRPAGLDGRTKAGKDWVAANADRDIISAADNVLFREMADAVRRHPVAGVLVRNQYATELPIFWTDAETGLACKGKIDLICRDGTLVDLKKTVDLTPSLFFTQAYRLGYHLQAAYYHDGLVANGIEVPRVVIVAMEGGGPYDVVPFTVPADILEQGRTEYRALLRQVADCQTTGVWPGVSPAELDFQLPRWAVWNKVDDGEDDISDILEN